MPAPFTIVTILDEDGEEFPVRLPGVYPTNKAADVEAALQIARNDLGLQGELTWGPIEYVS